MLLAGQAGDLSLQEFAGQQQSKVKQLAEHSDRSFGICC
jgi:hypothetical protein